MQNVVVAQELSVDFEEQLTIGDRDDAPKEYLFGGPQFIRTDSKYRIYVATMNNTIRVFSPKGTHIKTIGRRGKGPGEFLHISAMTIGHRGELIVYDGKLKRLTRFYNLGDSLDSHSLSHPTWMGGVIVPIDDQRFASTAIQSDKYYEFMANFVEDLEPVDYDGKVIHILNKDFTEKDQSLFDVYSHLTLDKDKPLESRFATSGSNYRLTNLNETTLVITNVISDGILYLVDIKNGEVREVPGHFKNRESYEILNWERRRSYPEKRAGIVTSNGIEGQFVYQKKLESRALMSNDKWVVNFIQTADDQGTTSYNIEFLDTEGDYLGYTRIDDDFTTVMEQYNDYLDSSVLSQKFYPMHLDNLNQLYYLDTTSDVPVIHVTKIIIE